MATMNSVLQQALAAQLTAAQNNPALNSQLIWSPPTTATGIGTGAATGIANFPAIAASSTVRERSKREQALSKLASEPSRNLDKVSMHYKHVSPDAAINIMGKFPPVMNHRPTRWIMHLLCCASAPHKFPGQLAYRLAGLTYVAQANPLGKFCKMRLTVAGYELLVHYAKNKKFKPFFDAFVPKTARDEIYAACFDFEMNAMPEFIKKDGILMAERMARRDANAINQMRDAAKAFAIYHNQPIYNTTSTSTAVSPLWTSNPILNSSGALQTASQTYANMINSNTQSNSLAYSIAGQVRHLAGKMRVSVNGDHVYVTDNTNSQHLVWKP